MKFKTFKGGIYPPGNKDLTKNLLIEKSPLPDNVIIPLVQHIGAPCKSLVTVKDHVKVGQKIGEMEGFVSAPIYATISGTVKRISEREVGSGSHTMCIEIESDGRDDWIKKPLNRSLDELEPDELINIMREAGLVGLGGAGFPTHVKFSLPDDVKIDTILINGSECEPYLNCDYRIMIEYGEEVLFGLQAMMKAVDVKKGIIAIKDDNPEAIENMQNLVKDIEGISVMPLKDKYPQGGEKLLIDAVLNRRVPSGKLPIHVGVIVNNVQTAYSFGQAVRTDLPLVERVLTVSGQGVKEPKNLLVRIGTSCEDIIEHCGGLKEETKKVILGGPMTGYAQYKLDIPVDKKTSGIIALTENEVDMTPESPCIRCGRCVDVCPINLVPSKLDRLARLNRYEQSKDYHIMDCIECGSCAYICPAHRHLVQSIVSGKNAISSLMNE